MSRSALLILACITLPISGQAQPVINSSDMFDTPDLYYRAYANAFNPNDISGSTAYLVPPDLIGSAGLDQFWDFSRGPTNKIYRFDYLTPTNMFQAADFPAAQLVEKKTDSTDGSEDFLFFTPVPGEGRKVYGFYAQSTLLDPVGVFVPPIVDFPYRISYGQEWSTSTMYESTVSFGDPEPDPDDPDGGGGFFELPVRVTQTSQFKADAAGTIVLPDSMGVFGDGLRINEQVQTEIAVDLGEGYETLETDYTRNYYWMMPGYGIVAQLNSTQATAPPPENFSRATAFLRMFETNKKPSAGPGGCEEAAPVTDLRVRVNNGALLLSWTAAECANSYVVQYTTTPEVPNSWQPLGDPTTRTVWVGENTSKGPSRFYRVVSVK